jgi:hypothetical protein
VELHELADDLLTTTGRDGTPFGVYVLESGDPSSALARQVERDVFLEFFGNTVDMLDAEYRAYDAASTFLCVIDHERRVTAGMIRLISPSPAGFKTLHDLVVRRSATACCSLGPLMMAREIVDHGTRTVERAVQCSWSRHLRSWSQEHPEKGSDEGSDGVREGALTPTIASHGDQPVPNADGRPVRRAGCGSRHPGHGGLAV